ncbi:MAG: ABC transporter substrate-binding protein, partial [Pseudomonadota bacterium]
MQTLRTLLAAATVSAMTALPAQAEDPIKIGIVTTLTTPAAVIGEDVKKAFELAHEHMGGQINGTSVELIFEDDGFRPEIGKQATDKLIKQDGVDVVTGYIWSHVLLASVRSVLEA